MPVFGLNNGLVPIIAYNYGAQKKDRMMRTIKVGCIWAVSIMLVGMAVMEFFPEVLLGFFEASEHMVEIGVPALRIICISFIFAGLCITVGSYGCVGDASAVRASPGRVSDVSHGES